MNERNFSLIKNQEDNHHADITPSSNVVTMDILLIAKRAYKSSSTNLDKEVASSVNNGLLEANL